jgi:hypothetical protein
MPLRTNINPKRERLDMPKSKKKVPVHDKTPVKDPKGGGHKHGKGKGKGPGEQTGPIDPIGWPVHYVP